MFIRRPYLFVPIVENRLLVVLWLQHPDPQVTLTIVGVLTIVTG